MNHELTPEEKLSKLLDLYLYLKVGIYIVQNTLCVWKGGGGGVVMSNVHGRWGKNKREDLKKNKGK